MLFASLLFTFTACYNDKNQKKMKEENNSALYPKGQKLPNDWFSGNAFLTPLVAKDHNNEFSAGSVTFEIGARTNWHTHPKGQVLLVIDGKGIYQEKGKPAKLIEKGDVINISENVAHWHGATASTTMTHIAITNYKGNEQVTWLDAVTNEEFDEANTNAHP